MFYILFGTARFCWSEIRYDFERNWK